MLLLDQLGGIWEIATGANSIQPGPAGLKGASDLAFCQNALAGRTSGCTLQARGHWFEPSCAHEKDQVKEQIQVCLDGSQDRLTVI
jgi:hypothetical protein